MPNNIDDIVIDTNVLVHAGNPNVKCFSASLQLLKNILDSEFSICVDEGSNPDRQKNKSLICHEYLEKLRFGSFAFSFLTNLFQNKRVIEKAKNPGRKKKKIIEQTIRNRRDRTFICVTCNSSNGLFASNDFEDFQRPKRAVLKSKLGILIRCSEEICPGETDCLSVCSQ